METPTRTPAPSEAAAQEKLRRAAALIEEALPALNTSATPCGTCGRKHFENFEHAKLHEQLEDLPAKLRRVADRIPSQN